MRFVHAFACALACALATGAGAQAPAGSPASDAPDRVTRTMAVTAADLDLSGAAGRQALEARLRHAAAAVCRTARHPQARPDWDEIYCVHRALRTARLQAAVLPQLQAQAAAAGGNGRAGR